MRFSELLQSSKESTSHSAGEMMKLIFTNPSFYAIVLFVLLSVFVCYAWITVKFDADENKKTYQRYYIALASIASVASICYFTHMMIVNQDEEKWTKEVFLPYIHKEPYETQQVERITYVNPVQCDTNGLYEFTLFHTRGSENTCYQILALLKDKKGVVTEREFVAKHIKKDLKEEEIPYVEYKMIPKHVNTIIQKGWYETILHVDESMTEMLFPKDKK